MNIEQESKRLLDVCLQKHDFIGFYHSSMLPSNAEPLPWFKMMCDYIAYNAVDIYEYNQWCKERR